VTLEKWEFIIGGRRTFTNASTRQEAVDKIGLKLSGGRLVYNNLWYEGQTEDGRSVRMRQVRMNMQDQI